MHTQFVVVIGVRLLGIGDLRQLLRREVPCAFPKFDADLSVVCADYLPDLSLTDVAI